MSSEAIGAIADRYSAALFALAEEKAAFEAVETDLKALKAMLADSADLRRLVSSPVITRRDQGNAIVALAEKAGWNEVTRNLLGLLAKNRRLFTISGVIDAFLARLAAGGELPEEDKALAARRELVGPDPVPYGIEANRSTLEAIIGFARAQHILSKDLAVEEMFIAGAEG